MYTSVEDVATELGRPLAEAEQPQIASWIARVEARIATRIPDLDTRVTDQLFFARLTGIVSDVVARKARNPEGMRSERIDDYYYDRGAQTADLMLTDAEWAELMPELGTRGAFSIRPSFTPGWC